MSVTTLRKPKRAIALFDVSGQGKRIFAHAIAELKIHRSPLLRANGEILDMQGTLRSRYPGHFC